MNNLKLKLLTVTLAFSTGVAATFTYNSLFYDASTIMQQEYCKLHGTIMRKERVPILYGLYALPVEYHEASRKWFTNAHRAFFGRCVGGRRTSKPAWICERCLEGRSKWLKERRYLDGESSYGEYVGQP